MLTSCLATIEMPPRESPRNTAAGELGEVDLLLGFPAIPSNVPDVGLPACILLLAIIGRVMDLINLFRKK